jgi:hypothetical protein
MAGGCRGTSSVAATRPRSDTIMSAEDFSEPYYRTSGERGVLAAAGCLASEGERPNAATLAALLQDPDALAARLERADRHRFAGEAAWLTDLTKGELSALRGIASKLARLIQSEGSDQLIPDGGPELDLEVGDADRRDRALFAAGERLPPSTRPSSRVT